LRIVYKRQKKDESVCFRPFSTADAVLRPAAFLRQLSHHSAELIRRLRCGEHGWCRAHSTVGQRAELLMRTGGTMQTGTHRNTMTIQLCGHFFAGITANIE